MVLLRRFESIAQIACRKGETPGFLHLYIGEEATGVGVCAHLRPTDWVTSTHRGHGHALAKGANPGRVMAELFGKTDGICGGRGGTMHLYDRSVGLFGTNGIVAAGIGHAVGIGMSARQQGRDDIGVAFFGDGAANHGGFHEALNFAAVQRAPLSSSARTISTPRRRRSTPSRSIPRSPPRPPPTACLAWRSTATTSSPSGWR
ncbi:thiamine pyrophosphate-dependent dehydrogenase E1 component subunit alpha [Mesorhizobium sp. M7D.F.Ca.US.004.01.2.1]|uniref:thiamine pyrophosphate-dependent dehydrogenase E1 component subunit alpha n=1 Tax=Mesorhizobium sp. M7D.F.Ca.US.004.01.2.1 TaxID=2496738 RepID=UPI001FE08846|nr:thiamine pyrophosphate-dependent dehydrogenase E1 component subunit alpha [Mesorhizobium sp. M7D.F.Ca.US.004.01.2.1]